MRLTILFKSNSQIKGSGSGAFNTLTVGPLIFRDRGKRTEFAESAL